MAEADFGKLPDKWNGGIVEEVAKKDKYGRVPQAALKKYGWFNYNFNMITYRGKLNVFYMAMGFWGSVYYLARRKIKKNKAKNAAAAAAH